MSKSQSKDRSSRCSFTFADGRRCRMPRQFTLTREGSGHPLLCGFHARREAQAQAAEEVGRDIRFFLSGDYLSACNLSLALGRVFAATARGDLKPKTAGTLAYLGQTLLQTIHHAENEYINAFSTDRWRRVIHSHVNENSHYLFPAPPPAEASLRPAAPLPGQTQQQLPAKAASQSPEQSAFVEAGLPFTLRHEGPGVPHCVSPSVGPNSSPASQELVVSDHVAVPAAQSSSPKEPDPAPPSGTGSPSDQCPDLSAPADPPAVEGSSLTPRRLPRNSAQFAATVFASATSSAPQHPRPQTTKPHPAPPAALPDSPALQYPKPAPPPTAPSGLPILAAVPPRTAMQPARPDSFPCSARFTPASSPEAAASPSNTPQSGAASSAPPSPSAPKLVAPPPVNNSSPDSSQPTPRPTQASDLPGFGAPANWEVLIPQTRGPVRRRRPACRGRQIRPWHLPE